MTASAALTCQICTQEFELPQGRRGAKPTICPSCTERYRNPPEQATAGLCRMCQEPSQSGEGNKRMPWQAITFCAPCYAIYRKIYLQDAKRKERAK